LPAVNLGLEPDLKTSTQVCKFNSLFANYIKNWHNDFNIFILRKFVKYIEIVYMKKDKKTELRNQDKASLQQRLQEISKELIGMKMEFVMGKLKNLHSMKVLKKERAVINTILAEK